MKKLFLASLILCQSILMHAQMHNLSGFMYGKKDAPTGHEWQSPTQLSLNKLQPRAWFFSFADVESARKVLPQYSHYYKSLDGNWAFHWVNTPDKRPLDFYQPAYNASAWDSIPVPSCWNVVGIQKDGSLKYGKPIYVNQKVIFAHHVAVGDWKGGVMRTPPSDWTTYIDRNEVGSYRRTFTIPSDWDGRRVTINFDGVNSFYYLWINGHYIGFTKNSRNTGSFDITDYIHKGENLVAVEVYRNSDGSFIEAQDMFRLPGIFRSVYLTSEPNVRIQDLKIIPDLDANYTDGSLQITAEVVNSSGRPVKGYTIDYSLYANKLYSQENHLVTGAGSTAAIARLSSPGTTLVPSTLQVKAPAQWSAEAPHLYTLIAQLKDRQGRTVQTTSTTIGFRKVEIKDTPADQDEFGLAGRYYYINGKPVKLKGVNRQEINPETGNTITAEQIKHELMLMKQYNINHIRCSHYSNTPIFYYLCNLYGIYLEDEANIESHEYYYGAASLSHVKEFEDAHVARVMELVGAHINDPSVVIWSLGNEAGPGKNFEAAYHAIKDFDTSRPVQYERNNSIVDMGSNQYPSIAWTREAVKGHYNIKYPFHISEYAHSMGNAGGDLADYWEAIESTNFFCGGAIWDWVDQALYNYDPQTGERYWAYGGDFGDKPNSGMFCMNGILLPDHTPKPEVTEVKKVYQDIAVTPVDLTKGTFKIFNKRYFTDLSDLALCYTIVKDGMAGNRQAVTLPTIAPRHSAIVTIPYQIGSLEARSEYYINLLFTLKEDRPWASKGYTQMSEQIKLQEPQAEAPTLCRLSASAPQLKLRESDSRLTIEGKDFCVVFDNNEGTIYNLKYGQKEVIADGNGPKPDLFRAPTDNDNWADAAWVANGLHALKHKVTSKVIHKDSDGSIAIAYTIESQADKHYTLKGGASGHYRIDSIDRPMTANDFKLITHQIWTVYKDGSIQLNTNMSSNKPQLAVARLGYHILLPKAWDHVTYYGRGPLNNYNDRKTGSFVGRYSRAVKDMPVPFPKPQSMGNREDVRWCAFTQGTDDTTGVLFSSPDLMSMSALPWSALEMMMAPHTYQLPLSHGTHLHLDMGSNGLGGNSCGQGPPLAPNRMHADGRDFTVIIRPFKAVEMQQTARITPGGYYPIVVNRDRRGIVSIISKDQKATIVYSIDGKQKPQCYTQPFDLRDGGTVTAYYKDQPWLRTTMSYERIESIQMTVMACSSQETGSGDVKHLIDANPATIWHTMYSVTVAGYPHWVEFDAGESKTIKGFTYLPRQDGSTNGDIKNYSIEISVDGKHWKPLTQGVFSKGKGVKKVLFDTPVKTRYVRFNALSSQNGADYASCAEFTLLSDK